jgi:hypothetical protein
MTELEELLQRINSPRRKIKILAVTRTVKPDVSHLQELGMDVERVIGNKVIGVIDSDLIADLENDDHVAEVERSVMLSPHNRSNSSNFG